jgi:tetratricopeptide (TPR) repeat protein
VCRIAPGDPLRLWLDAPEPSAEVRVDGTVSGAVWRPLDGGWIIDVPAGEVAVSLSVGIGHWELPLAPPEVLPADHPSSRAREASGDDIAAALVMLEATAADHRAAGRASRAWRDVVMSAWLLRDQPGGLAPSLALLAELPVDLEESLQDRFIAAYGRGLALSWAGEHRAARRALSSSARLAEREGDLSHETMARDALAHALQRTGRHDAALELLEDNLARVREAPCDRARAATGLAWGLMIAGDAGVDVDTDWARELLLGAQEDLAQDCDRAERRQSNVALNLALEAVMRGDSADARRWLAAHRLLPAGTAESLWAPWITGQLALMEGEPEQALEHFTAISEAPPLRPTIRWRGCVGQADALAQLGEHAAALQRYTACSAMRAVIAVEVSVVVGQQPFLSDDAAVAERHAALLLETGQPEAALAVLRRWRARYLSGLPASQRIPSADRDALRQAYETLRLELDEVAPDWQWTGDQLRSAAREKAVLSEQARLLLEEGILTAPGGGALREPARGELVVLWASIQGQLHAFALSAGGLLHVPLGPIDLSAPPPALAEALLGPLAEAIAAAERLTLLPPAVLRDIDLHALPLDGVPLGLRLPTAYALDVVAGSPAPDGPAVIVADPLGDLPGAAREGDAIAAAYAQHGRPARRLHGAALRRGALLGALQSTSMLHFAGHGLFDADAWESALLLADGTTLTVGDILALPAAPRLVVLSGCETARAAEGTVETLGLAQAFLLAGSQEVVAATRPVRDDTSRRFSIAWHRAYLQAHDPAAAWRAGVEAISEADWSTFRRIHP